MPASLGPFSLLLVGSFVATVWLFLLKKTHWGNTRAYTAISTIERAYSLIVSTTQKNKWSSLLFTIFILCLSFNIIRLIPYTFSQTSHLSITFRLSLPLWLGLQLLGTIKNWKAKLSHLVPEGTPSFLIPLMVIIETIRLCIQPLTLGFRLGANLLAGHLLIFLCSCVVWERIMFRSAGVISFLLLLTLFALEIAVACIQAAVFTILAKQYLEEKV